MLLFVFFIAVMNLAVGYALGAGLMMPSISTLLPQRSSKPVIADIDDAEPLSRPAPTAPPASAPAAPAPAQAVEKTPEPAPQPAAKPKPGPADVMASLAQFREKLNSANVELKLNQADPEKFEQSANKLQQANHGYLEEAEEAIKHLEELGASGDTLATETCEAVTTGATEVAAISSEIDGIIEGGLSSDESRQKLVDKSTELHDAAVEAEKGVTKAVAPDAATLAESTEKPVEKPAPAPSAAAEPTSEEVDALFDRLEGLLKEAEEESVSHVAAIRVDPLFDSEGDDALLTAVERSIAEMTKGLLEEGQSFVPGRPAMFLLEGDNYDQALERIEKLRQQVEATEFSFNGMEFQATVTCAFADAHKGDSRDQVIDQLNQALAESANQGANKTYHHDGAFPTETQPVKVKVDRKKVELS